LKFVVSAGSVAVIVGESYNVCQFGKIWSSQHSS